MGYGPLKNKGISSQEAHLDMAETDPDLDQDFPKMSISWQGFINPH